MRYFRITLNPLDPYVLAGPGGTGVQLRLPFWLVGKMFYSNFKDGGYVRVDDEDMGTVGPIFDVMTLGGDPGPVPAYKMFQESVLPLGALDADIPLWSAQAVPLVQPPDPMPQVSVWPVLAVVTPPDPG